MIDRAGILRKGDRPVTARIDHPRGTLDRCRRRLAGIAGVLALAAIAACAEKDTGPYVLCTARDSGGGEWVARDINPLSAQDEALDLCGEQSAIPTTCVATSCVRQW